MLVAVNGQLQQLLCITFQYKDMAQGRCRGHYGWVSAGAVKRAGAAWTAGSSSKTAAQIQKRKQAITDKLGVKKPSGIRKSIGAKKNSSTVGKSNGVSKHSAGVNKGKAAVAKAGKVSGRMSEAAKHAAAAAAQSVQKVHVTCTVTYVMLVSGANPEHAMTYTCATNHVQCSLAKRAPACSSCSGGLKHAIACIGSAGQRRS